MREFMTFDSQAKAGEFDYFNRAGLTSGSARSVEIASLGDFALGHIVSPVHSLGGGEETINETSTLRLQLGDKVTGHDHGGDWEDYGHIDLKALGGNAAGNQFFSINPQGLESPTALSFGKSSAAGEVQNIPASFSMQGTIAPGSDDIDSYSVVLTAGVTYMFSLYGSGGDPLSDTYFYFADENGNVLDFDDDGGVGVNSLFTFTPETTGTYQLGAAAYPGSGLGGTYTLDGVIDPGDDVVPDTFGGASPLSFGADNLTYGFIDEGTGPYGGGFSEVDTFSFTAQAGFFYTFDVAGGADYNSDWIALPDGELDTVVVIYDEDGNVVASNDDINFPSDISSRVGFFAEEGGTYYLDVFSYAPWQGGFSIRAEEINLSELDPLDSIHWLNADNVTFDTNNTAYVYFGDSDENFGQTADDGGPMVTIDWNDYEKQQVMLALEEYERILGVDYEITDDVEMATFRLLKTESQQYGAYFFPQDPTFGENQGVGVFNVLSGGWNFDQQQSLEQGGYAFAVILHEFGHAHGLAHPHDQGGGSDVMAGVGAATGSFGVYDLNQGVYTVMSYNDAWQLHPDGPSPFTAAGVDNGWSGTLSAFDIAMLQERYGVTTLTGNGNNFYELKDVQAQGTYYETIWDAGGTDGIFYSGANDVRIDLTAATLDYSPTGGGVVSYVDGIHGGYTIANGVVIERALGGSGNDTLIGNDADNVIRGNGGDDVLLGGAGGDILDGGDGFDTASYINAEGGVFVLLGARRGEDADGSRDKLISIEALQGSQFDDDLRGSSGDDRIDGLQGDDKIVLGAGNDVGLGRVGDDTLKGGAGDDYLDGLHGADWLVGGDGADTFAFTHIETGDIIFDFESGSDQIDLTPTGVDFTFVGDSAFSGVAGELRYEDGLLEGDVDGDGAADLIVDVRGDEVAAPDIIII